jgi:Flp pilus assembly protein TadG
VVYHNSGHDTASQRQGRCFSRFIKNENGAAAMEFGLVVLPFMALMLASLETSVVFFAQQNLDSAVESTARKILTGETQKAGTDQAAFKTQACANLPDFMTCSNLFVSVKSYSSYGVADLSQPTITYVNGKPTVATTFDTGDPGNIIVVRLMYENGPLGSSLATLNNGQRMLISTAVVKAELY